MPYTFFSSVLEALEGAFRQIEAKVSPPVPTSQGGNFVFRYVDRTIEQAIVQKLARMISGLHAIETLLERGLFQEQGAMQRMADEIEEDLRFLSIAVIQNDVTERHREFLDYFYAEEFADPSDIVGSHESRGMLKRDKIRAYIQSKTGLAEQNAARGRLIDRVPTKAYSGYVHAASPHIMDMYVGTPPTADVSGASKQVRYASQQRDATNYFYRAVLAMALAAQAFHEDPLYTSMRSLAASLDAKMRH